MNETDRTHAHLQLIVSEEGAPLPGEPQRGAGGAKAQTRAPMPTHLAPEDAAELHRATVEMRARRDFLYRQASDLDMPEIGWDRRRVPRDT